MRVNPPNSAAHAFVPRIGDKERARYRTGFIPMDKGSDAVKAPEMNLWERPVYKPEKQGYMRSGANDFLSVKSKGF